MMTQINTFQDLLDLLDSNPQYVEELRARLLTAELIALPEKVAELAEKVAELAESVAQLSAKVDEFIATTNRRLGSLDGDVGTLKGDVKTLKDDVATLKGSDLERRARENILNIAKDEMGLTRGRVLLRGSSDVDAQFRASVEQAEAQGRITEEDADNLLVADIIIRARRAADRQYVYAVFEVSRTISNRDIDRAHDRAKSMAAIAGDEVIAAVIGEVIQPRQREQAEEKQVSVVLPAMFGREQSGENDG